MLNWIKDDVDHNLAIARFFLEGYGLTVRIESYASGIRANTSPGYRYVDLNAAHRFWGDPWTVSRESRLKGYLSSGDPVAFLYHEIAHTRDQYNRRRVALGLVTWSNDEDQRIAQRVSRYASRDPIEFVAETFAALRTGRKLDWQVMRLYRQERGAPCYRVNGLH
jgi:hypothetical protein